MSVDHVGFSIQNTVLNVANADDITVNDYLQIGSEIVKVTGKDNVVKTILTVARNQNSTIAADHFNGAAVSVYEFGYNIPLNHPVGSTTNDAKVISYDPSTQKIVFVWDYDQTVSSINQITLSTFDDYSNDHLMFGVQQCLNNYRTWYPYLSNYTFYSSQNLIQKTEPSQGYHTFHSEDDSLNAINRTLAWMVYLNDVDEGGETEFLYQQIKVIPKRGRVVIWPGTFTHLHRGNPPFTTKYIATGWLCYNPKNAMITGY